MADSLSCYNADTAFGNVFETDMDYESDEQPSCGQPMDVSESHCPFDQDEMLSGERCSFDWNSSGALGDDEVLEVPKTPGRDEGESDSYSLGDYGDSFFIAEDPAKDDFDINAEIGSGRLDVSLEEKQPDLVLDETSTESESESSHKDYIDPNTGEELAVASMLNGLKKCRVDLNSMMRQDALRNHWLKKLAKKRGPLRDIRILRRKAKKVRNKRSRQMESWTDEKTAGRGDRRLEF